MGREGRLMSPANPHIWSELDREKGFRRRWPRTLHGRADNCNLNTDHAYRRQRPGQKTVLSVVQSAGSDRELDSRARQTEVARTASAEAQQRR